MPRRSSSLDITPSLILRAYAAGLFPMAEGADDPNLFWVEPEIRGIFPLDGVIVSRSLAKVVRSNRFVVKVDTDFDTVIDSCASAARDRPSTWINGTIRRLYRSLFDKGHVHTVETYQDDRLVGGLYGVSIGGAFFGESMFHRVTDASKVALVHLAARLIRGGYGLLDAQFVTPHLATLGAIEVQRDHYRHLLNQALAREGRFKEAGDSISGLESLGLLRGTNAESKTAHDVERMNRYLPAGSLPPKSLGYWLAG